MKGPRITASGLGGYLPVTEAARVTGLKPMALLKRINRGRQPALWIAGRWWLKLGEIAGHRERAAWQATPADRRK